MSPAEEAPSPPTFLPRPMGGGGLTWYSRGLSQDRTLSWGAFLSLLSGLPPAPTPGGMRFAQACLFLYPGPQGSQAVLTEARFPR